MLPTIFSEPFFLLKFSFKNANVLSLIVVSSVVMHYSRETRVVSVRSYVIEALMMRSK